MSFSLAPMFAWGCAVCYYIAFKSYISRSTYCYMQGSCFICINYKNWKYITLRLESQPLTIKYILINGKDSNSLLV